MFREAEYLESLANRLENDFLQHPRGMLAELP